MLTPAVDFDCRCAAAARIKRLVGELGIPDSTAAGASRRWTLTVAEGALVLTERHHPEHKPLSVDLVRIRKAYKSLPIPKRGPMAPALGRSTRTIIDATAGWGQDAFLMWLMGYDVIAVERSVVIGALLMDGVFRFRQYEDLPEYPRVVIADSIDFLKRNSADCVYLDPMFPAKRKWSALAKRPLRVLRELVGDDDDRAALFDQAWQAASRRVVVKRPNYAKPWRTPDQTFVGKLMSYDLYLKGPSKNGLFAR
jgi:16S rRNA (guanine1516-N2)-methyltransferase